MLTDARMVRFSWTKRPSTTGASSPLLRRGRNGGVDDSSNDSHMSTILDEDTTTARVPDTWATNLRLGLRFSQAISHAQGLQQQPNERDHNKNVALLQYSSPKSHVDSMSAVSTSAAACSVGAISGRYNVWSWRQILRRRHCLALLAVLLLLLYVNSSQMREPEIVHYSHVPGMRASATVASTPTQSPTPLPLPLAVSAHARLNYQQQLHRQQESLASAAVHVNDSDVIDTINATYVASAAVVEAIPHLAVELTHADFLALSPPYTHRKTTPTVSPPPVRSSLGETPPQGYLVWSDQCKMPNIDPYLPEVMTYFKREKYKPCESMAPLTHLSYNETTQLYVLHIEHSVVPTYSRSGAVDCCYQAIERNSTGINADKDVTLGRCITFKNGAELPPNVENILVKCRGKGKQVYANGHAMMPRRQEIRDRLNAWKRRDASKTSSVRPASVLMIGIDSISRINLIRAMPRTAQYLYDNEWFEMSGYNKMDDNTFPNLMAVLTGLNKTSALRQCPPTALHGLENCSFVWNAFQAHGYVTAYAEDETSINTFNYCKVGFERAPVDYYLRPFLLGAETHLRIQRKSNLIYCLGYRHSAEYVYDYALELAIRYADAPFFGLFWTNTFSHNGISDCSSMDDRMVQYLRRFETLGTLNNTVVVFFSDHGMRFGPTRRTISGHVEERLPFMFLWLPSHLKQSHPEFVNALSVNRNRLTNPFDLHVTLKHVLELSGRVEDEMLLRPAEDCPRCQSLLAPVPHNRSCAEIAIEDHWCMCIPYQSISKDSKIVQRLAHAVVEHINDYVAHFHNGSFVSKCVPLAYGSVDSAYRAQPLSIDGNGNEGIEKYRIVFYTKPNTALFEATVRYGAQSGYVEVTGEVSRLNAYSGDSDCVEDGGAKKYCSCRKKKPT